MFGLHVAVNSLHAFSLFLSHVVLGLVRFHACVAIFFVCFLLYAKKFKYEADFKFQRLNREIFKICEEIHIKENLKQQQLRIISMEQQQKQQQQQQQKMLQQQQSNVQRRSTLNAQNATGTFSNATSEFSALQDSAQSFLGIQLYTTHTIHEWFHSSAQFSH